MYETLGADRRHRQWIAAAREQFERAIADARRAVGSSNRDGATVVAGVSAPHELPGYEIVREVHRGGQGVVYRAIQQSTRRTVAVKVLREGPFAGDMDRLRFEREVSILAQLDHRGIVGILDRGHAAGVHFLVMDFVDGRPLDRFARENGLVLTERLDLFSRVCDAVSAAHLRGVIHRDLKPGNILVDAAGDPWILDFGLAKSATTDASAAVTATQTGQFVGSLAWASPEQAMGRLSEVDIRSDVYSLGVVLYQLVTDRLPYTTVNGLEQALANIRNTEPVRPSAIAPGIDDDLETIVLKCLAKEPARRYQSVGELARDIRHFLAGEAIEAKRDSGWYVLRRALRRHKLAAGIAIAFVLLVSASTVALSILYRAKVVEQLRAAREREQAVAARERAETAAARADAVVEFLRVMLSSPDPGRNGYQVRVVDVLKSASAQVSSQFAGKPEVAVAVRSALGETYYGLGMYAEAESEFAAGWEMSRNAWGEEREESIQAIMNLSMMFWVQGKLDKAEPLARKALELRLRTLGDLHDESISAMTNLAAIMNARGRPEEGIALNQRALAAAQRLLGPGHERAAAIENNLAFSLDKAGRLQEAEACYRRALAQRVAAGGAERPETLIIMQSLANCLRALGKLDEAESLAQRVLALRKQSFPPGHAAIGDAAQTLGRVRLSRGDADAATELFREALAIHQAGLPPESWRTAVTRCDLGRALTKLGQFSEAERFLLDAHAGLSRTAGDHPRQEQEVMNALVEMYEAWDDVEPGHGRARQAAEWRAKSPASRPSTRSAA